MKVTFLMDNEPVSDGFLCEHGFSCWIETESVQGAPLSILFDTAQSEAYLTNAEQLGIDVKHCQYTVVSHGHYDHGGGLSALFKQAPDSRVYLSEKAFDLHMKGNGGENYLLAEKSIGLDSSLLTTHKKNLVQIRNRTVLEKNIFLETHMEEPYPRPANSRLCMVESNILVPDDFSHEIYLTVQEKETLYVFTGCAHRGAANIMAMTQERYPHMKKYCLLGGFHLSREKDNRQIELIKDFIKKSSVPWHLVTGHCTGMTAFKKLKTQLNCPVEYGYGGSCLTLGK